MPFDMGFCPVLRFGVISDVHLDDEPCVEEARLRDCIDTLYALSDSHPCYKKLDALAVVGDFTSGGTRIQMEKFERISASLLREGTQLIMTLASHEFRVGEATALETFKEIFALTPDVHTVINDFHFIALSTTSGCRFNEDKRLFAERALREAADEDGKRPVFFFQHPHITDTVYGSINWGEDELNDILIHYPQIVDFSGHSHAPINDPRSVHQRHFSCFGTGTLSYFELDEFDKTHGTIPPQNDEAAQVLIVEADAKGRVRVYPYDLISGSFFPFTWEIDEPWNPESFLYTDARYRTDKRPFFPEIAEIFLNASGEIEFTQAQMPGEYVDSYDIFIRSDSLIKRHYNISSRYYLSNMPKTLSQKIDLLQSGKTYVAEVFANSFWRTKSARPLRLEFVCP